VFAYTDSRKRDGPASFLAEYRGYLQADAFSGYDRIYAEQDVCERPTDPMCNSVGLGAGLASG
jgi:hypothetical protein